MWARSSPDGTQLLFHTYDTTKKGGERWSIVLIDVGKTERKLIAGPYASYPSWFADGKQIIYIYLKMKKPRLVKSSVSGVGMTFISPSSLGESDGQPDISPDGKTIAFNTELGNTMFIGSVNVDGSNFTVYTEGYSPRWHPNRKIIAFDRSVGGKNQSFIFDMETGQVTQLTSGDAENLFPVWSPDGKWLAFVSNRDGKHHLYAMKADGSQVTQLTKGETQEYFHDWSSDGYIYFSSYTGASTAKLNKPWFWNSADIWRLKPILPD
jgi:TolB protein